MSVLSRHLHYINKEKKVHTVLMNQEDHIIVLDVWNLKMYTKWESQKVLGCVLLSPALLPNSQNKTGKNNLPEMFQDVNTYIHYHGTLLHLYNVCVN